MKTGVDFYCKSTENSRKLFLLSGLVKSESRKMNTSKTLTIVVAAALMAVAAAKGYQTYTKSEETEEKKE
jgi:hypothetical protein